MKKVLSIILAIMMIATAVPMAFAAEECEHEFNTETLVRASFTESTYTPGYFVCAKCNETVEAYLAKEKIAEYVDTMAYIWYIKVAYYYTEEVQTVANETINNLLAEFEAKYEGIDPYYLTEYETDILSAMIDDLKLIAAEAKKFENDIIYNLESSGKYSFIEDLMVNKYNSYIPEGAAIREETLSKIEEELDLISDRIFNVYKLMAEYAKEHPEAPYNPEYIAEVEECYDLEMQIYFQMLDCIFNNKHIVETFTDCGDGTHIGACTFCVAEGVTEAHTWGEYTENADYTKTAKCVSCDATDTVEMEKPEEDIETPEEDTDEDIETPEEDVVTPEEEIPFEKLEFYEKIAVVLKDFFDLLKNFFEKIFG